MDGLFCGWCRRDISAEVYLASIEFTKGGVMHCFRLEKSDKTALSTMDLAIKKLGMDLVFPLCGMNCGDRLLKSIWKDARILEVVRMN